VCLAAHGWKFRRWTPSNVKPLLPPRHSRGVSLVRLEDLTRQLFGPAAPGRPREWTDDLYRMLYERSEEAKAKLRKQGESKVTDLRALTLLMKRPGGGEVLSDHEAARQAKSLCPRLSEAGRKFGNRAKKSPRFCRPFSEGRSSYAVPSGPASCGADIEGTEMKKIGRLPGVKETCGLSRSEIYRRISRGDFPRQVRLGKRAVGWDMDEVDAWVRDRINARQTA
jgi:prophage regulatory protein